MGAHGVPGQGGDGWGGNWGGGEGGTEVGGLTARVGAWGRRGQRKGALWATRAGGHRGRMQKGGGGRAGRGGEGRKGGGPSLKGGPSLCHRVTPLSPQLMLTAVLNCLFDSLSQMLRYEGLGGGGPPWVLGGEGGGGWGGGGHLWVLRPTETTVLVLLLHTLG